MNESTGKKILSRFTRGFCYALAINVLIFFIISLTGGGVQFVPGYAEKFSSREAALLTELILIGVASGSLSAGTVIMELERLSLLVQSLIYYVICAAVWGGVGCFCWGMSQYPVAFVTISISYTASYAICWIIQYRLTRKNVREINEKLASMNDEDDDR